MRLMAKSDETGPDEWRAMAREKGSLRKFRDFDSFDRYKRGTWPLYGTADQKVHYACPWCQQDVCLSDDPQTYEETAAAVERYHKNNVHKAAAAQGLAELRSPGERDESLHLRQRDLLGVLFHEAAIYTELDLDRPAETIEVDVERFGWRGESSDFNVLANLRDHEDIISLDAVAMTGVMHDVLSSARSTFQWIDLDLEFKSKLRGYIPLWDAIRDTYAEEYADWWRDNYEQFRAHMALFTDDVTGLDSRIVESRLRRVKERAVQVFGDEGKAEAWLHGPLSALGDEPPERSLTTQEGYVQVLDVVNATP